MAQTILVVDDEKHIVQLVKLYLTNEGYQVEVAHNGQEALDKVRLLRPRRKALNVSPGHRSAPSAISGRQNRIAKG